MAIDYVGGQTAGRTNASSAVSVNFALTGGLASTPAAGDLVIVTAVTGSAAGNPAMAVTTPTGYTALGQLNQSAVTADTSMNVSYKIMGGTPDTAVTIPGTGNNAFGEAYTIQVFRGVDATTPMDTTAISAGGTGTGRPNPGSITPVTAGAWVVICGGGAAGTGANYTAPANFTTDFLTTFGTDTTDAMVGSGYWSGWTSGAVDPAVYTGGTTGANDSWTAYTLALRPIVLTPTRGRISYAEAEAPFVATRGRISYAEVEAPFVPTRGRNSFAELETPDLVVADPTRGQISYAELETPFVGARGRISFAEVELPITPTRGRISFAEFENPALATRGRVSYTELEIPFLGTRGRISFAEAEFPLTPTRGRISYAEMETSLAPTRGRASFAELETPAAATRGRISFVELQLPDLGGAANRRYAMSGNSGRPNNGDLTC
jgi:hypothetical protein